jgi:uncharacterized protein YbcC (UPF0753/DUF2309 family)
MTTLVLPSHSAGHDDLAADVDAACRRIAPQWPLDRWIAVSPYWGLRDLPIAEAACRLGSQTGARLAPPRELLRALWQDGRLERTDLEAVVREQRGAPDAATLLQQLELPVAPPAPLPCLADLFDAAEAHPTHRPFGELLVHQIGQHCAAWFDKDQATWPFDRSLGLFGSWRQSVAGDRTLPLRRRAAAAARCAALPAAPLAALGVLLRDLGITKELRPAYFASLLGTVRGWAATCAHARWQAELQQRQDDQIVELLAIRCLADVLLVHDLGLHDPLARWRRRCSTHLHDETTRLRTQLATDWLLLEAAERTVQRQLARGLANAPDAAPAPTPSVQAVFCIDVRSERFRRHLEQVAGTALATRGFAGFFGVPMAFTPLGAAAATPQLPGLLAPRFAVPQTTRDARAAQLLDRRRQRLHRASLWHGLSRTANSAFSYVETLGWLRALPLLRQTLGLGTPSQPAHAEGLRPQELRELAPDLSLMPLASRVALAGQVLRAMGLHTSCARLVLLAGHGSSSTNNPHAAGLDCGACGGQPGEPNARALAQLLNDPEVRAGLAAAGIQIPSDTWFVAGLHNTTTDDLRLFDDVPPSHAQDLLQLRHWLGAAGDRTRAERAPGLGLAAEAGDPARLHTLLRRRAADWAETRPEWGLANNRAFVVAPRGWTRHLDLEGQVFLQDYTWRDDADFATLTAILTAPMLVTHWINLQYFASTVDPERLGAGNKVLHNVVGGTVGVFEGNGGDLRLGLPLQSVHDGERWRHTPLRLSVFVAAPREAIDRVIAAHEVVRQLVDHGWLHLLQVDDERRSWRRRAGGGWSELPLEA